MLDNNMMHDIRVDKSTFITDAIIKLARPMNISVQLRDCKRNVDSFYIELVYDNYHNEGKFSVKFIADKNPIDIATRMLCEFFIGYFEMKGKELK